MIGYFEKSQEVRIEIESSPELMRILENHYSGKETAQNISDGQHHIIYRIGQLSGGLWVAMRHNLYAGKDGITSKGVLSQYETYATDAEDYSSKGKRVTQFCVGVAKTEDRIETPRGFVGLRGDVALLVEDFTMGGTRELEVSPSDEVWANNPRELIYVDIGSAFRELSDFQYMAEKNMILL
ncbi:hypothetical protein HYU13_02645 [Candidatus Woesearchaeota archaeon]|nr:hypothetical protein [Candidatus Woesearchaeota archaeon]